MFAAFEDELWFHISHSGRLDGYFKAELLRGDPLLSLSISMPLANLDIPVPFGILIGCCIFLTNHKSFEKATV